MFPLAAAKGDGMLPTITELWRHGVPVLRVEPKQPSVPDGYRLFAILAFKKWGEVIRREVKDVTYPGDYRTCLADHFHRRYTIERMYLLKDRASPLGTLDSGPGGKSA